MLAHREQLETLQLEQLIKLIPAKPDTWSYRVAERFEHEFLGQSLAKKMKFVRAALHWVLQRAAAKVSVAPPPAPPPPINTGPFRVAVHGTGSLGDFCTHMMFIQEFYRAYGPMQIDFYCHPKKVEDAKFFFKRMPIVQNVVSVNYLNNFALNYDLIIYLRYLVKYHIMNHPRIYHHNSDLLNTIDISNARFEPYTFIFEKHPFLDGMMARSFRWKNKNLLDVVGYVGNVDVNRKTFPVFVPDLACGSVLERHGLDSNRYITVHDGFDTSYVPAGGTVTKCWPIAHWNRLVEILKDKFPDLKIVQLGSLNSRKIEGVDLDLRQQTTLDEAAWIIKHSALHVDGESGLVRLAHALHTRSVVLFGPTSKYFFGFDSNINLSSTECSDCWWSTHDWLSRCPRELEHPECMETITPEHVARHIEQHFKSLPRWRYRAEELTLYGCESRKHSPSVLADIFKKLDLTPVPISQHTENRYTGVYLHASKQWEYVEALRIIEEMAAELGRPLKIADVGSGRGALSVYLAGKGHDVEVFDIDYLWDHNGDLGIESRFQKSGAAAGLKVSYGSLFNVPAESSAYDIVLSVSVLEHVPHKDFGLREALRLLKAGGKLFLSFDFAVDASAVEGRLRVEVFSPERLKAALASVGIEAAECPRDKTEESAAQIQKDGVAGIPPGMTVASLVVTKLPADA